MKNELPPRGALQENTKRIIALNEKINQTVIHREESKQAFDEWKRACAEFHSQYDALAFPGGYQSGLKKIQTGDARAIEDALVFLEVRPYFFRSQYIRTKLLRMLKHTQLSVRQSERFQKVLELEKTQKKVKKSF